MGYMVKALLSPGEERGAHLISGPKRGGLIQNHIFLLKYTIIFQSLLLH